MAGVTAILVRAQAALAARISAANAARVRRALRACGDGVEFDGTVEFHAPGMIEIGDHVHIESRCRLYGRGGLRIEDHAIIAPEVVILTSTHNYVAAELQPYDTRELLRPVTIGRSVWIGFRAMILPGVRLGEGSIVGAGAVVRESCAPGSILAGNPATPVGRRDMDHYRRCAEEGRFYLKEKQRLGLTKSAVAGRGRRLPRAT